MLHTKFRGNRSTCFGDKFFNIYGHGGHLGHLTSITSLNFNVLVSKSLHTKFGLKWPTGF